jgi:hypothetical protein
MRLPLLQHSQSGVLAQPLPLGVTRRRTIVPCIAMGYLGGTFNYNLAQSLDHLPQTITANNKLILTRNLDTTRPLNFVDVDSPYFISTSYLCR